MDNKKIGKFISSLRKEKSMTQKDLADKLFVSDKAVSKWERGLCMPDISLIEKLANSLGVTVSEILKGEYIYKITKESSDQIVKESISFFQKSYFRKRMKIILIIVTLIISVLIIFGIIDCYRAASRKEPIFIYHKTDYSVFHVIVDKDELESLDSDEEGIYFYGLGYMVIKCSKINESPYYIFQLGHTLKKTDVCYYREIE